MKYAITGADAKTGKERAITLEADDETTAVALAKEQGVFAYKVQLEVESQNSGLPLLRLHGTVIERQSSRTLKEFEALLILIAVVALGFLITSCGQWMANNRKECEEPYHRDALDDEATTITMAQEFVKKNLKSPSSASFPWSFKEYRVSASGDNKWKVSGYVDAQNSFGATIRNNWSVEMKRDGGSWKLENIQIQE